MNLRPAVLWQYLIPQTLLCRLVYRTARCRSPWLARPLKRWFASSYRLDLGEAEHPEPDDYPDLNALFTRALAPGARPVAPDPTAVVSPVDGTLTQFGTLDAATLLQAKGIDYSLTALTGEPATTIELFRGGAYATIYLAPHDYHRVHAPLDGRLVRTRYIPGARFSVNAATTTTVQGLFCRNERAVLWLEGDVGAWLLVMVGALNVSSISTTTRGEITSGVAGEWPDAGRPAFQKGAELGRFNLGSTVILVVPPGALEWDSGLRPDLKLRMGQRIATLRHPPR